MNERGIGTEPDSSECRPTCGKGGVVRPARGAAALVVVHDAPGVGGVGLERLGDGDQDGRGGLRRRLRVTRGSRRRGGHPTLCVPFCWRTSRWSRCCSRLPNPTREHCTRCRLAGGTWFEPEGGTGAIWRSEQLIRCSCLVGWLGFLPTAASKAERRIQAILRSLLYCFVAFTRVPM